MLNASEFLKELYARLDAQNVSYNKGQISVADFTDNALAKMFIEQYEPFLPKDKNAKILDIGVGNGWFASLCVSLGYKHIELIDFGCSEKFSDIKDGLNEVYAVYDVETSIQSLLNQETFHNQYDFIHLSHVIEHIPKYDLIGTMDSLNGALKKQGTLFLRTPNLLGPAAFNALYCTGGHEYGFVPSNIEQFLLISNFEDIQFHNVRTPSKTVGQFVGSLLRKFYSLNAKIKYRAFEGYFPKTVEPELIVSSKKI